MTVTNYPEGQSETFSVENNPNRPEDGAREVTFSRELYIEAEDFLPAPVPKYKRLYPDGPECRLKGAYVIKCTGYETDAAGNVTAILAEYDPDSRGGDPADGRKVKGATIHWVDAATAVDAEVRLYDNLFTDAEPDAGDKNFLDCLNPSSLEVLPHAKVEAGLAGAEAPASFQFLRQGYFCVDNLPISLISKFAEMAYTPGSEIQRVALGVDVRSGEALGKLEDVLEGMAAASQKYEILFLDAADEVLVKRYKETRRTHPLARGGRVDRGIAQEREKLAFLKRHADYIIDTSKLLTRELNMELEKIFVEGREFKSLVVTVLSFGFKYGIPADADLVFDVRFLPNPYYIDELKRQTGNDKSVQDYVMGFDVSHVFLNKLTDMVQFLLPNYVQEGKNQLIIGIGCTGGKHRSVTLANKLFESLSLQNDYGIRIEHRDIGK